MPNSRRHLVNRIIRLRIQRSHLNRNPRQSSHLHITNLVTQHLQHRHRVTQHIQHRHRVYLGYNTQQRGTLLLSLPTRHHAIQKWCCFHVGTWWPNIKTTSIQYLVLALHPAKWWWGLWYGLSVRPHLHFQSISPKPLGSVLSYRTHTLLMGCRYAFVFALIYFQSILHFDLVKCFLLFHSFPGHTFGNT